MNIVLDTSVWSVLLRRRRIEESNPYVAAVRNHVERGDGIHLVGLVLQELLDGVAPADFDRLVKLLQPFPVLPMRRETFIEASRLRNGCRRRGIQASPADFLIASSCIENGYPLLTSDQDFRRIAKHCELVLAPV